MVFAGNSQAVEFFSFKMKVMSMPSIAAFVNIGMSRGSINMIHAGGARALRLE